MKRLLSILVLLLLLCGPALAQFTLVTGTVTDPNGLAYANGTISAQLVTAGTSPTLNNLSFSMFGSAGLDLSGRFTMRLADSAVMSPNLQWQFTGCSAGGTVQPAGGVGPVCFTTSPITITGASQDISAQLQAAALALTNSAGGGAGFNGVNLQTVSYPLVVSDCGKEIVMNGASLTLTLPNPIPTSATCKAGKFTVTVTNNNATPLTVANNGLTISGNLAGVTLYQNQSMRFVTAADGVNYETERGGTNHFGSSGMQIDSAGGGVLTRNFANTASNATITDPLPAGGAATTVVRPDAVDLLGQTASIGSTQLVASSTAQYAIFYTVECTTTGTGNVTLNIASTDDAGATNTNVVSSLTLGSLGRSSGVLVVWSAAAVINYSITYVSSGTYAVHIKAVQL